MSITEEFLGLRPLFRLVRIPRRCESHHRAPFVMDLQGQVMLVRSEADTAVKSGDPLLTDSIGERSRTAFQPRGSPHS